MQSSEKWLHGVEVKKRIFSMQTYFNVATSC